MTASRNANTVEIKSTSTRVTLQKLIIPDSDLTKLPSLAIGGPTPVQAFSKWIDEPDYDDLSLLQDESLTPESELQKAFYDNPVDFFETLSWFYHAPKKLYESIKSTCCVCRRK